MAAPVKLTDLPPNIYLNSTFTFDDSKGNATLQPAISQTTRYQPFISSPDKYFCSVGRFSVTGSCIPMLVADIDRSQPNPNITTSVVTLYQPDTGKSASAPVVWVPQNTFEPVPGPPNTPTGQDISSTYYWCNSYGAWAAMVSTAFASAQASFVSSGGTLNADQPAPVLYFNPTLGIAQLIATAANYNEVGNPNYLQVWVNGPLACYFSQFQVVVGSRSGDTALNTRIRIFDTGDNLSTGDPPLLTMSMETNQGLAEWCSLSSIAILTDLPIYQEQIVPAATTGNPNAAASQTILIDFLPDLSVPGSYSSDAMIFNAAGPSYRQYSFLSTAAISAARFRVVWYDDLGREFPLLLRYRCNCSLKLVFSRIDQFTSKPF